MPPPTAEQVIAILELDTLMIDKDTDIKPPRAQYAYTWRPALAGIAIALGGLFLFVAFGCSLNPPAPQPRWYSVVSPADPQRPQGQGRGETLAAAKLAALKDLAEGIRVVVATETVAIRTVEQDRLIHRLSETTRVRTDETLAGLRLTRSEQGGDGYFYVRYEIDLRPLEVMMAGQLAAAWDHKLPARIVWTGSKGLANGRFLAALAQRLSEPRAKSPTRSIAVDLKPGGYGAWVLTIDGRHDWRLSQVDWSRLIDWGQYADGRLSLALLPRTADRGQNRLQAGDVFALRLSGQPRHGHYTLFNLYADGRVAILAENCPLRGGVAIYPDDCQMGVELVAATIAPATPTTDLYLAVSADQRMDSHRFIRAGEQVLATEQGRQAHELFAWLDEGVATAAIAVLSVSTAPAGE